MVANDNPSKHQPSEDRCSPSYASHPVPLPLARFARVFSADWTDVYNNSRYKVRDHLAAALGQLRSGSNPGKKTKIVAQAHSILQLGVERWLKSIIELNQKYFHKLLKICISHPEWAADDPVEWTRLRMLELLAKELSPGSTGLTAIDYWFRSACDGDQSEDTLTGYIEPWCAPIWVWKLFRTDRWQRAGFPERLSANLTAKTIRSEIRLWGQRLPNEIGHLADDAGVAFDVEKREVLIHPPSVTENRNQGKFKSKKITSRKERKSQTLHRTGSSKKSRSQFAHSPDYRTIRFRGKQYHLTRNQSKIVQLLHQSYLNGTPAVGKELLLRDIEAETSRVRDSFKNSPLWRSLIIPNEQRRGTYQLNLV
jgi:hypothetical protein